ncbi:SipW-dependent-type signal peptide-containing protein [Halorientalis marina]|uniref:SipW-dependent-type signal peptide-containing protein n=1 Tax=Halorientalis marina TaxID=2931976 RepID=UPI001FF2F80D|nr:SipW-dependent-type signal peptide-containing protein [Halorientalis marina]
MTDEKTQLYNLSRRKVLAGLGAVGVASAGAGLGTSAFFSDREAFTNNSLVAGELDLLVDWQQHYRMNGETMFVNAHPDHDGDGEQSIAADNAAGQIRYSDFPDEEDEDSNGANIPSLDCDNIPPLSEAEFGVDPTTGNEINSLVQLADVKPGDSGEITFSLHLCDNSGYIWMQADGVSESEGVDTDPELAVDTNQVPDLANAINARLWYDEDCDNVYDSAEPVDIMLTLDFSGSMLYDQFGGVVNDDDITTNGTTYSETTKIDLVELGTRQFIDFLQNANADVEVGVAYFDGEKSGDNEPRTGILQPLTNDLSVVDGALSGLRQKLANVVSGGAGSTPTDGDGNPDPFAGSGIATGTYIGEGIDDAQGELATNGRPSAVARNIVLSDGESFNGTGSTQFSSPTDAAADARAASPTPATEVYTINVNGSASTLQAMAGPAGGAGGAPAFFYDLDDPLNISTVFGNLAALATQEKIIMEDTLANVLAELAEGNGIPLDGNRATLYDELSDPADDEDRDAFRGDGVMHCVALEWELPFDVGNEVQGDTVSFDLGFYTEQERNNDGSGPMGA